ncbi:MAG TPA: membrane protein insertase YidC [Rickettsiales bacterium]|nr:membrane protein insertase YidC [Rickettsiales bacterium]
MQNDNYNKRILVATLLSTALIVLWIKYYGTKTIPQEELKNDVKEEQVVKVEEEKNIVKPEEVIEIVEPIDNAEKVNIETENLQGSINLKGLTFNNLILKKYNEEIDSEEKIKLLDNDYFVGFGWESEDKNVDLPNKDTVWQANQKILMLNNPLTLSYKNKDGLVFKIIISVDSNYMFRFKQEIINPTESTFNIRTKNIISRKMPALDRKVSVHQGFIGAFNRTIEEIKYGKLEKKKFDFKNGFSWAGFTDKYWLVAFTQNGNSKNIVDVTTEYTNENFIITFKSNNIIINSKEKVESEDLLFAGPKILNLLDEYAFQYDLSLFDRAVDFGWFYFLTKPIYIVLKMFYTFLGNFGMAILLLTLVVKTIMFPFTKKSFVSMAKIKQIQPKIENIKARCSNDKLRMNKEIMELYKRENVSPLSGCLPMLVQIPVFFALYKVLAISIDMRQAPFFGYIKNLADKDPTTIWNLFGLLPYNVNFIQIGFLPCLMSLTMWLQQKMSSNTGGNQETQTAIKLMPIIFLFLFAGMPAGLLVYWTFSNIISIGQQYYVERKIKTK